MNKKRIGRGVALFLAPIILVVGAVALAPLFSKDAGQKVQSSIIAIPDAGSSQGYARAEDARQWSFPQDFGPHPDFQTEWWYYTGNLQTAEGRRFGFQLTFFRRALQPPSQRVTRPSDWAADQVFLAHFTLTDVAGSQFRAFERLERGAAGLAGARITPGYQVWLHDWSVESIGMGRDHLHAQSDGITLDLDLQDGTGPVLQGEAGLSQKGSRPGNASYYYSLPRLNATGQIGLSGSNFTVTGTAWMDHEFSTSALEACEIGWDWFALQLSDGSEIMLYDFRRTDGSIGDYSNGMLIAKDGSARRLNKSDFKIEVLSTWRSPHTQAVYPAHWRVSVPAAKIELDVQPLLADQELNLSYSYWEGAVKVSGSLGGNPVSGVGYVELTGYARPMKGV